MFPEQQQLTIMLNVVKVEVQPHLFQDHLDLHQRQNAVLSLLDDIFARLVQEFKLQTDAGTVFEDTHPSHDPTHVRVQNLEEP